MKRVTVYTDGACSGNPGPGGWGAILRYGSREKELSGGEAETTNNRMELTAVISALEILKEPCRVEVYTDSRYIADAVEKGWLQDWKARRWRRKDGALKNHELWQRLEELMNIHRVTFIWVKGHAENEYNNRCDAMAVEESRKFRKPDDSEE